MMPFSLRSREESDPLKRPPSYRRVFSPATKATRSHAAGSFFGSFGFSAADVECEFDAEKATRRCDVIPTVIVPIRPHRQCRAGEELVRIFRPTFSASPLTTLAGAGEKCGAENESSSPRHFEHRCNASENLLPKTHTVPTGHSKPRRTQKSTPFLGETEFPARRLRVEQRHVMN